LPAAVRYAGFRNRLRVHPIPIAGRGARRGQIAHKSNSDCAERGQARKYPRPTRAYQFGASLWTWWSTIDFAAIRCPPHDLSMRQFCSRTHPRWRSYDYAQPGVYFVTTNTRERNPVFGRPTRRGIVLTNAGRAVHHCWLMVPEQFDGVMIDRFVVMPDHVHAIVVLLRTPTRTTSLSQVVGWTKQRTSLDIRAHTPAHTAPIWQRSFHDSIIRNADALNRVRKYITANPSRAWNAIDTRLSRRIDTPA
jgi:REP-associated tyrosine transposase